MIDEGPGDQSKPHVAWNGTSWLVAWVEPVPSGLPTYERIRGVRVAPDGTVLDAEPILIHQESWGCYCDFLGMSIAGGGADGWVVLFKANADGLRAVRVLSRRQRGQSGWAARQRHALRSASYDIAFAQDEYLILYQRRGTQGAARRYSPTLQLLGTTAASHSEERSPPTERTFMIVGQCGLLVAAQARSPAPRARRLAARAAVHRRAGHVPMEPQR